MIVKDTAPGVEETPTGTHIARCISLIGVGTHIKEYKGKERHANEIVIVWELPFETKTDGTPFTVSKFYTRSLAKKANLRKDLVAWRGKDFTEEQLNGFDMKNILDKGCQVVLTKPENRDRVDVSSVAGIPKGVTLPERVNELKYFDVYDFKIEEYNDLSERMQEWIAKSIEFIEIQQHGRILSDEERKQDGQILMNEALEVDESEVPF